MRRGLKKCWIFSLAVFLSLTTILARVPPTITTHAEGNGFTAQAVDLYGSALGSVTFSGGKITRENAPTIDDTHSFVRAYVIDSETGDKEEIESAELRDGRVFFKLINENEEMLERSYTQGDAASKIYFEYLSMAETIKVTFEPDTAEGQDIILTSSSGTNVAYAPKTANGVAEEHFTVSVPRNATPVINTEGVTFEEDVSTAQRTVYRYKVSSANDINVPITSSVKNSLTITTKASNNGAHADDWNMTGIPACSEMGNYIKTSELNENNEHHSGYDAECIRKDYFYSKTELVTEDVTDERINTGEEILDDSKTISYGDTVHLKAYHDMTYYAGNKPRVYSSFMSILYLNGQPIGAPQPLARFGDYAYPGGDTSLKRPYFQKNMNWDGADGDWEHTPGYSRRGDPSVISAFTRRQGWRTWDPWWDRGFNSAYWNDYGELNKTKNGFYTWYNEVIKTHVIGQSTTTEIEHGPLAGATVTIKITDAKPDNYVGRLNTFDEVKANVSGVPNTLDEFGNVTGWNNTRAFNRGAHNSLRVAYDITIENAPADVTAKAEWSTTLRSKAGMYLNYGVENTYVQAAKLNDKSTVDDKATMQKADSAWFEPYNSNDRDANGVDTKWDSGINRARLDNPLSSIAGQVKNGYTNPVYRDLSVSQIQGEQLREQAVDKNASWTEEGDFGVTFPLYSSIGNSIENDASNGFVSQGGMNVIGVEASLVNIPVNFDYDEANGGTVQNPQNFPDKATSLADASGRFLYNVEGNPLIHVPLEIPSKENAKFVGWHAYTMLNGNVVNDLGYVKPGENLDIRSESQMGSRINDTLGDLIFDSVHIAAEYVSSDQQATDSFIVNHVYKENEDSEQEDGSETVASFVSIHGSDSSLTESGEKKFAPDKLEYNGNKYKLVLSDDASPRGGYTTFTDTSTSMTFTYVRTRGTVKVRYEDTEGNLLPDTKEITLVDNGLEGTEYESTKEEFTDYVFVDMKEDSAPAKGTVQEGDQTVVYVYRPKVKVPNTGLDVPMGPTLAILLDAVLATGIFLLIRRKRRGL